MDVFGLPINELIFSIFLPLIFFFLFIYALLKKSQVFGNSKEAGRLNSVISLVVAALGIFSLYTLGLTVWLPYFAAVLAVAAFFIMYVYGVFAHSTRKLSTYSSGDAFKSDDEKRFDSLAKDCKKIWEKFKKEKNPEILRRELEPKLGQLDAMAKKLGKTLYDFEWYNEIVETMRGGGGGD